MKKISLSSVLLFFILSLATSCTKTNETNPNPSPDPGGTTTTEPSSQLNVTVSTIAGKLGDHGNAEDGNGANARFWNPTKMVFDSRNNLLYVADGTTIRSVDNQNNVKTYMPLGTISGFNEILDIDLAPGAAGSLYCTTKENDLLKIEPNGSSIKMTKIIDRVYGGNSTGQINTVDNFDGANGVAVGKNGEIYFFNSYWNTLHRITLNANGTSGMVDAFAGKASATRSGNAWPFQDGPGEVASFGGSVPDIAADGNGNIYVADFWNDLIRKVSTNGNVSSMFQFKNGLGIDVDGPVSKAEANRATAVAVSQDGNSVFFTTYGMGGRNLPSLRMVRQGKEVITLVGKNDWYGDGPGTIAGIETVGGIATTPDGKTVYVSESGKKVLRKITIQ